jgi:hypothetical protein
MVDAAANSNTASTAKGTETLGLEVFADLAK